MTSAINTNGINVNYPVPGINNSSQGFRDNFTAIRTDLNTAATEITDLQNNVVVKQALSGTTLNNDMANTLISNAATRGFRHSTFNLGNAISGTLVINASLGDVQTGTINGNTTIQFTGWAPSGTQSNVEVQLNVGNTLAVISLPSQVTIDGTTGIETIENYANANGIPTLTIPYNVNRLDYRFSSLDCGDSITIEPYNQPRQSTQIQQRIPSPVGEQGDVVGTVCVDTATSLAFATCTATEGTYEIITCDSTAGFYLDMPVQFTGIVFGGVTAGTTYYVRSIPSATTFTISATPGTTAGPSALVNLSTASGSMTVSPVNYMYVSSGSYDATIIPKTASNTTIVTTTVVATNTRATGNLITLTGNGTNNFVVGYPVAFSGTALTGNAIATYSTGNLITVSTTTNMLVGGKINFGANAFGGLSTGNYYITYINSPNIAVSTTFGGSNLTLSDVPSGLCAITYGNIMGNLSDITEYFVQSIEPTITAGYFNIGQQYEIVDVGSTNWTAINAASNTSGVTFIASGTGSGTGTATALNQFTISTTQGGAPVTLASENGSMNVTTVTDYTITLNSTSNIANNDPIVFSGNVSNSGIVENTIYYIANIANGTTLSISKTRANGIAGQKMALTTAPVNMVVSVYEGTSIWKRTQLNNW
jgi:hypothetical protein